MQGHALKTPLNQLENLKEKDSFIETKDNSRLDKQFQQNPGEIEAVIKVF